MDRIFILGALSAGSLYFLHRNRKREKRGEGFEGTIPDATATAFGSQYTNLVAGGMQKHNDLSRMTDPLNPPGISVTAGSSGIRGAQVQIQRAITAVDVSPSGNITESETAQKRLLNAITPEGRAKNVVMCEAVKSIQSCDVFDRPDFGQTCGLCFEGGQTSKSEPHLGGLYVDEDTIDQAKFTGRKMMDRFVQYNPTVGKCAPGMFVVNKKQCVRLMNKLKCQKQQNFDIPGCSQCLENETFSFIDGAVNTVEPKITFVGNGDLTIFVNGSPFTKEPIGLSTSMQSLTMDDIQEGDRVTLTVKGGNSSYLAGYLAGSTASGEFSMDLNRLILVDTATGSRPRVGGQVKVGTEPYMAMKPGKGKEEMSCEFVLPFTFVDPSEKEAITCPSGPFVTKSTSAQFLNSGPCFVKGAGPGNYNQECIMQLYLGAGCNEKGTGYPSTNQKARELLVDEFGKTLSLAEIAERIYDLAIRAFTGRTASGDKLVLSDWDYASTFCLGIPRKTPCDVDNASTGPLPPECIQYIYENRGSQSHIGQTYDKLPASSRFATDENRPQGCTPLGTVAPYDEKGNQRPDALKKAVEQGGVDQVKKYYDQIHKKANDNSILDENRKNAIQQCYGIELKKQESTMKNSRAIDLLQAIPAFVYGDYNMAPWSVASSYPDKDAKWIGGRAGGNLGAPGTGFVNTKSGVTPGGTLYYRFQNSTASDIPATIYVAADNNAIIFMNDTQVYNDGGGWGGDWPNKKFTYSFKPGASEIVVLQTNAGGPEGLLLTAISNTDRRILFHSDASWKMIPEYKNTLDDSRVLHSPELNITFDKNSIQTFQDNLCVDVQGFGKQDGSRVFSYPCNGYANQTWSFDGDGRLKSLDSGKCLRTGVSNNNPEGIAAGKAVVIGPCDDSDENKWSYDKKSKRILSQKYPGQCLDIFGGVRSQASLMVYQCHTGENQRFLPGPTSENPNGTRVLVGPPVNLSTVSPIITNFGAMPRDYTFEFKIHILGKISNWGAIFRFSSTKNNCCNYGDRVLAGWLYPGDTRLHIRIGDPRDGNWGVDSPSSLPMNRDVDVRIVARGANVKLFVDDVLVNQGNMPSGESGRFTGDVTFGVPEMPLNNGLQHGRPAAFMSTMTIR